MKMIVMFKICLINQIELEKASYHHLLLNNNRNKIYKHNKEFNINSKKLNLTNYKNPYSIYYEKRKLYLLKTLGLMIDE